MEHRSSTIFLHWFLSWACRSIWVHYRPICHSSCSLIFSNCFSAYHSFVYLEDSKKVPVWLCCYVVSLVYVIQAHPIILLFVTLCHAMLNTDKRTAWRSYEHMETWRAWTRRHCPLKNFTPEELFKWGGRGGANWCPQWIHRFTGLKFLYITRLELHSVQCNNNILICLPCILKTRLLEILHVSQV